jgi:hypothetical protein
MYPGLLVFGSIVVGQGLEAQRTGPQSVLLRAWPGISWAEGPVMLPELAWFWEASNLVYPQGYMGQELSTSACFPSILP